jgi:hypothetical protein
VRFGRTRHCRASCEPLVFQRHFSRPRLCHRYIRKSRVEWNVLGSLDLTQLNPSTASHSSRLLVSSSASAGTHQSLSSTRRPTCYRCRRPRIRNSSSRLGWRPTTRQSDSGRGRGTRSRVLRGGGGARRVAARKRARARSKLGGSCKYLSGVVGMSDALRSGAWEWIASNNGQGCRGPTGGFLAGWRRHRLSTLWCWARWGAHDCAELLVAVHVE